MAFIMVFRKKVSELINKILFCSYENQKYHVHTNHTI